MKKKNVFLLALAVVLVLSASVSAAFAYFTTYAEAKGGYEIEMGETHIREDFYDWTKRVTVVSDEDAQPVYVRARAFSGSQYPLSYSGEGWTQGSDGYFYYDQILYGGQVTSELVVRISGVPEDAVPGSGFNVVVIYETTPVQYDENGNPYADWNITFNGGAEG